MEYILFLSGSTLLDPDQMLLSARPFPAASPLRRSRAGTNHPHGGGRGFQGDMKCPLVDGFHRERRRLPWCVSKLHKVGMATCRVHGNGLCHESNPSGGYATSITAALCGAEVARGGKPQTGEYGFSRAALPPAISYGEGCNGRGKQAGLWLAALPFPCQGWPLG
jgi:hypothetical protein